MDARIAAFARVGLFLMSAMPGFAQTSAKIVAESIMIPSGQPGIEIYVCNKHLASTTRFTADRTLLFVQGATYPASTTFDLQLGGVSFMDDLAADGFDVYAMDLPGYGKSSRPAQMGQPPDANPPFETTADAVHQYGMVGDYVLKRRSLQKLDAMGWSWGTTIAAGFTTRQPGKVERLVLYAPIWLRHETAAAGGAKLGAYRSVTIDQARRRWLQDVPEDKKDTLIPLGWFDTWQKATWATDPTGNAQNPPVLMAPNGVVQDFRIYWHSGKPTYDPAEITVPTLLVRGEWDIEATSHMSQTLFPLITHAPWKRYVEIGEGTHTLMLEKNRAQLWFVVENFLTEPDTAKR